MVTAREAFDQLLQQYAECQDLGGALALMSWDQETHMPSGGAAARAQQRATLAGIQHERFVAPKVADLLAQCEADLPSFNEEEQAALREYRLDFDNTSCLPKELVEEFAAATSAALHAWQTARSKSDFAEFAPHLQKVIDLCFRKAEIRHQGDGPLYDALLDQYERGATCEDLTVLFRDLKADLVPLVEKVTAKVNQVADPFFRGPFARHEQAELGLTAVTAMGFDLGRGRIDPSTHPFCSSMGFGDTRLTQRFDDADVRPCLYGVMHEAGHGLYEQGLPERWARHPLGEAVSLGIHESQSRLWENMVGRSRPYWQYFLPVLQKRFPQFADVTVDQAYRGVNRVTPSFIRVEADEVTYNLHVILRYEMEQAIFQKALAVKDIPAAWNEKMKDLLGIVPNNDAEGCLQDIHWPMGAFGYFSTYTLGNVYAAQLFAAAGHALPDLERRLSLGNMAPLRDWLHNNVHDHGRRFGAEELLQRVTGTGRSHHPLIEYLTDKMVDVYGIDRA